MGIVYFHFSLTTALTREEYVVKFSFIFLYRYQQVKEQIQDQVKNMIINYRDDLDLKNLVDWVQQDWVCLSGYVHGG